MVLRIHHCIAVVVYVVRTTILIVNLICVVFAFGHVSTCGSIHMLGMLGHPRRCYTHIVQIKLKISLTHNTHSLFLLYKYLFYDNTNAHIMCPTLYVTLGICPN
jgi:hypothetical protein